jgi:hypothetical protein
MSRIVLHIEPIVNNEELAAKNGLVFSAERCSRDRFLLTFDSYECADKVSNELRFVVESYKREYVATMLELMAKMIRDL